MGLYIFDKDMLWDSLKACCEDKSDKWSIIIYVVCDLKAPVLQTQNLTKSYQLNIFPQVNYFLTLGHRVYYLNNKSSLLSGLKVCFTALTLKHWRLCSVLSRFCDLLLDTIEVFSCFYLIKLISSNSVETTCQWKTFPVRHSESCSVFLQHSLVAGSHNWIFNDTGIPCA